MLYSEIIAVCSQIHTERINTMYGQNVECRTYRAVNTLRLGYKNYSALHKETIDFFFRTVTQNLYLHRMGSM